MVLPNALLFPDSLLPLYIFEPRYRAMLEWSLEQHRMFCIALVKRGISEWHSPDDFHHVAGVGLVRACVRRSDGTFQLILQGLTRVHFVGFSQEQPFIIAELREILTADANREEADTLSARVLELCARYRALGMDVPEALDNQLAEMRNPAALSDLVAHAFVRDPYRRQSVLEKANVAERLRTLIEHLQAELL